VRLLPAAVYAVFFVAGVATTMLSPLMPLFEARWHLDDASAGLLFAAQFVSAVCASGTVGWLAARTGYFALLAPGLLLMAAGSAGLALSGWPAALLLVACYGAGLGLVIPAGNLGLAAMHRGSSVRPLALLNLSWCAGAVLAPILVVVAPRLFLPLVGACCAVLAAGSFAAARQAGFAIEPGTAPRGGAVGVVVAAILFLYVGTENAMSGWMPTRAVRGFGENPLWSALPSVFWIAMLAGRALTPALVRRVKVHVLLYASLLAAMAAALSIIFASGAEWLLAGGALGGLSLAPVFPLTVSQWAEARGRGSTSGLVFSVAGLGGAVVPPLVGLVSTRSHDIRLGMSLVLLSIGLMLWLQVRLSRLLRP
jgi:fucose permease